MTLKDGTKELYNGTRDLSDGVGELKDGTKGGSRFKYGFWLS